MLFAGCCWFGEAHNREVLPNLRARPPPLFLAQRQRQRTNSSSYYLGVSSKKRSGAASTVATSRAWMAAPARSEMDTVAKARANAMAEDSAAKPSKPPTHADS